MFECACGCGREVHRPGYRKSHRQSPVRFPILFCACGCGTLLKPTKEWVRVPASYAQGHHVRVLHPLEGKHHSEVTKSKISHRAIMASERHSESAKNQWADPDIRELMCDRMSEVRSELIAEGKIDPVDNYRKAKKGPHTSLTTGQVEIWHGSYELRRMIFLDSKGFIWTKKHKIKVPYRCLDGRKRRYIPDFLVYDYKSGQVWVEEVKGYIEPHSDPYKFRSASLYLGMSGILFKVLFEQDLEKI